MLSDNQTATQQRTTSVSSQPAQTSVTSATSNNMPEPDNSTYNNYEEEDLYPETFTGK